MFSRRKQPQRTMQTSFCASQTYQSILYLVGSIEAIGIITGHPAWTMNMFWNSQSTVRVSHFQPRCQATTTSGSDAQGCPLWWLSVTWEQWEGRVNLVYQVVGATPETVNPTTPYISIHHQSFFPLWTRFLDQSNAFKCHIVCPPKTTDKEYVAISGRLEFSLSHVLVWTTSSDEKFA